MPRNVPPEAIGPLSAAIGMFVYEWVLVETAINYWIAIIYQSAGGKHLDAVLRPGLAWKSRFLRRCFRRISALDEFASECTLYLDSAKQLAGVRGYVVHGYIASHEKNGNIVTFVRIDIGQDKTMQEVRKLRISIEDFLEKAVECELVAKQMLLLSLRLLERFAPEHEPHEILSDL